MHQIICSLQRRIVAAIDATEATEVTEATEEE
jgi:hypothetical protein